MSEKLKSSWDDPALEYQEGIKFKIPTMRKLGKTALGKSSVDQKIAKFQSRHNL